MENNVQSKQTHLEYARNRRAAGAATELEVLRAEVDLENQRAEVLRSENEVAAARATLNTVMVRPTSTPVHPTDTLAVIPFTAPVRRGRQRGAERARGTAAPPTAGTVSGEAHRRCGGRREAEHRLQRLVRLRRAAARELLRAGLHAMVGRRELRGAVVRRPADCRTCRAGSSRSATP